MRRAVSLVQGPLLQGFFLDEEPFEEWLQLQRSRIEKIETSMLERYARACDALEHGPDALAAAERLIALDPLREDWQRLALLLHARYSGPHEAAAQAKRFVGILRRELDVEPEPETIALLEEIRRGTIARIAMPLPVRPITSGAKLDESRAVELDSGAGPGISVGAPGGARRSWPALSNWGLREIAAGVAALGMIAVLILMTQGAGLRPGNRSGAAKDLSASATGTWRLSNPPSPFAGDPASRLRDPIIPIAVLPFKALGEPPRQAELAAAMITENVVYSLSRIASLRVISLQTTRAYQARGTDMGVIGTELGVGYVLEGNCRIEDGLVRVTARLVDPNTQLPVWSMPAERVASDRASIEDEIVHGLAGKLRVKVVHVEREARSDAPDINELVLKGWAALDAAGVSGLALRQAEQYFARSWHASRATVPRAAASPASMPRPLHSHWTRSASGISPRRNRSP